MNVHQHLVREQKESGSGSSHLLAVPRSDCFVLSSSSSTSTTNTSPNDTNYQYPPPKLLLVQLPSTDWKVSDLQNAYFVVHPETTSSLVIPGKGCSFDMHKVETSNAWVLVPPPPSKTTTTTNDEARRDDTDNEGSRSSKRTKLIVQKEHLSCGVASDKNNKLIKTCVRLLGQGSGACFMELRPKILDIRDLYLRFKNFGIASLPQLALNLQCSIIEVEQGLEALRVMGLIVEQPQHPADTTTTKKFGLWNRAIQQKIDAAIVATLTEACPDYVEYLPDPNKFVSLVMERIPLLSNKSNDDDDRIPHVQQHWIQQAAAPLYEKNCSTDGNGFPDVDMGRTRHVARLVAHALLSRCPVWSEGEFWQTWRLGMPGATGDAIHVSFLQGLAVQRRRQPPHQVVTMHQESEQEKSAATDDGMMEWVFAPVHEMLEDDLTTSLQRFMKRVSPKPTWKKHELDPYLQHWSSWFGISESEILQNFEVCKVDKAFDNESREIYRWKG